MTVKILLLLLTIITASFAQTFTVATTSEFRQALENATVNGESDTIIVKKGTYKTTDDNLGTFKFSDNEPYSLMIKSEDDTKNQNVIFSGDNMHQVFNLTNIDNNSNFSISNLLIIDGNSSDYGGGIYTDKNLTIKNVTIANNFSNNDGGGIFGKTMNIYDSNISKNSSRYYGGIYTIDGYKTVIKNSILNSNKNGAIYNGYQLTVYNSKLLNNTSNAIVGKNINVELSEITGNVGTGIRGYRIIVNKSNISSNQGGAISSSAYNETVIVKDSNISNNTGNSAIFCNKSDSTLIVVDSILTENIYKKAGGAIYSAGNLYIINSIFTDNIANIGGAIYGSTLTVLNSIFNNNSASDSADTIFGAGIFINNIFSKNKNDIYFGDDSKLFNNFIDYTKLENESSYTIIKKNNIQSSSNEIGFTDTDFRLSENSPVINKGLDPYGTTFKELLGAEYETVIGYLKTDKDGNERVSSSAIDMGAYENGSAKVCAQVITYAIDSLTNTCKEFATPCDVPNNWKTVVSCPVQEPSSSNPSQTLNCNENAISKITISGQWFLLGADGDNCSVSALKEQGAKYVYPFNANKNNYYIEGNIERGYGFWIMK